MNESENPLGRFGMFSLFVAATLLQPCGVLTVSAKTPNSAWEAAPTESFRPTPIDPAKPNDILSQFTGSAYNSLTIRNSFTGLNTTGILWPRRLERGATTKDTLFAIGQNRRLSLASTVPQGHNSLTVFEQIKDAPDAFTPRHQYADFVLTAYALSARDTGKSPGDACYGITYCGTRAKVGRTVAVDPAVIPIGTVLWIEGIGYRIAEDTGGAVKGHHIDVLMGSDAAALRFGIKRHITIRTIYNGEIPR